ncbi:outer membrane beta-barrel protein [Entomospira entomophila]|uniref:Porin family protein n=1 Tax=Entomospira entomophila TaxID=2719988 RepID=A0A968GCG7_9SPIO|nr:outer membrane beta-barrel protein [Entomospira entomophilus]NIZ40404.1 porin family protein [Entomospira entomophilus]WDI35962.1 outer membrane beta-barrel protein [Entomospira entomophilus]
MTKKIMIMTILFVCSSVFMVGAQDNESVFNNTDDAHWAVGVKGGLGFNWAFGALGKPSAGALMKGHIGVFGEYAFMRYVAIQSDFMIGIRHGFKRENYQLSWTTMDFDIMIKGRLPLGDIVVLTLGAGLSLSTGIGPLTEISFGVKRQIRFADYAINAVGMGMAVELGGEFNLPNNAGFIGTSLRMDWKFNQHHKTVLYIEEYRPRGSVHTPISVMLFYGYRWYKPRLAFLR